MLEQISAIIHATVTSLPSIFSAPPPSDPPRLRIGLGGDIPVFPPLAMIMCVAGGFGVSKALGGDRSSSILLRTNIPIDYHVIVQSASALVVATIGAMITKKSSDALSEAGTKPHFQPVPSIADTGPFEKCRNPMYWAILCVPGAIGLATDNAVVAVGSNLVLWLYFHFVVVPAEEKFLEKQLGDAYKKYCARVKRWGIF